MKLVFIYGPAAAGKLTVARELASLTGLALFHNHLIVDAVAAVFPFGSEHFVRLREQFWLATMDEAAGAGRSLIFTFAPEATVAVDFPQRVVDLVTSRGGEVAFVRLTLPISEQEQRLTATSRREFGKLRSVELLRQLRSQFEACDAAMPAPAITINTAAMLPPEAAKKIVDALNLPSARLNS